MIKIQVCDKIRLYKGDFYMRFKMGVWTYSTVTSADINDETNKAEKVTRISM